MGFYSTCGLLREYNQLKMCQDEIVIVRSNSKSILIDFSSRKLLKKEMMRPR